MCFVVRLQALHIESLVLNGAHEVLHSRQAVLESLFSEP